MGQITDKQAFDAIGKALITRGAVSKVDLDAIVDKDGLFAGVIKRVAQAERVEVRRITWGIGAAYASVSLAVAIVAAMTIFTVTRTTNVAGPSTAAVKVPA